MKSSVVLGRDDAALILNTTVPLGEDNLFIVKFPWNSTADQSVGGLKIAIRKNLRLYLTAPNAPPFSSRPKSQTQGALPRGGFALHSVPDLRGTGADRRPRRSRQAGADLQNPEEAPHGRPQGRSDPATASFSFSFSFDTLVLVHGVREARGRQRDRLLWPWSRTTAWRDVKAVMAVAGIEGPQATPKGPRHG